MIAWFVRNPVGANLLLIAILFLGVFSVMTKLPLEIFPESEVDAVTITVVQRAATPEDMETGVTNRIEEAIADLDYVKRITSTSAEQSSSVVAEIYPGTDRVKALNDVKMDK